MNGKAGAQPAVRAARYERLREPAVRAASILPAPARPRDLPPRPAPDLLGSMRVLVVDDDEATCEMLSIVLSAHGARVRTASSAAAGLREVEAWQPDVLLSDISMPGEDGYSLIRRVRALPAPSGAVRAIAITALASSQDRDDALRAGFQAHLTKPLQFGLLLKHIAALASPAEPA
jgi:CheY-like chemotaxis protein